MTSKRCSTQQTPISPRQNPTFLRQGSILKPQGMRWKPSQNVDPPRPGKKPGQAVADAELDVEDRASSG